MATFILIVLSDQDVIMDLESLLLILMNKGK